MVTGSKLNKSFYCKSGTAIDPRSWFSMSRDMSSAVIAIKKLGQAAVTYIMCSALSHNAAASTRP